MEGCEVNSKECMNFATITPPEMMCFELSYPATFELTRERKIQIYMSVTPDAQLNDVAYTEGEDLYYILRMIVFFKNNNHFDAMINRSSDGSFNWVHAIG